MRKLSVTGRVLAVVIAAMVMFSGAEAFANVDVSTSLSLNVKPGKKVKKGTVVTFSGKLNASRKKCRANQTVKLTRSGAVKASLKTKNNGSYSFGKKVRKKSTWQVKYAGRSFGVHPNITTCLPSKSNKVTIRIRH